MPRGGRRPGAGAPFGNVNALVTAKSSRRYALALYFVGVLPPLRQFAIARGHPQTPAGRQRLHLALDIAASILRNVPDLPEQIEAMLSPHLKGHAEELERRYARILLEALDRPATTQYQRLLRALDFVGVAYKAHPGLSAAYTQLLMQYVEAHPDYQPDAEAQEVETHQSNNQSIKEALNNYP